MDNSKTKKVNLPKTDFQMKANLPTKEPEILKFWEEKTLYKNLSVKNNGKQKFILHDGPPYANGHIHLGTALNKVLKDIIVKYKSMAGFYAPYTPGWDCHGLPIEQQCMKELKVDKHKVDRIQFRKQAGEFANKFIDIQRNEFKRLGVIGDWENPYLTMDPKYESVIVKVFGDLLKNKFIYRQKKPVYWCPTCETALAEAEVEYAQHISHSVYVKFKVKSSAIDLMSKEPTSVLIWTTTPWTLPANVALAFHPQADYVNVLIETSEGKKENLIVAKRLLPLVAERIGSSKYEIVKSFTGQELQGIKCKNPLLNRESIGVLGDFVTLEDGTGIVHIAPGHGQDDYSIGLKYNLPVISPVDDKGIFTDEVPDFKGHKVFAANSLIIERLKTEDALLYETKLTHSYPHCWRCKRAIIFRATPQWFMSVEHENLRRKMLNIIKEVKWVPAYGQNRITGMIEVRPDWCLSRQRLWGVPIPIFYCQKCNEPLLDSKVIDHIVNLFRVKGSDIWFEQSPKELLAGLKIICLKCKNKEFRKEEDILDVWFDSGVSNQAVLASGNFPELEWPSDMYLEGSDQHRGWFQTSLLPSVALQNKAPYKNVLTHGFVVDGEGKKMSKSLGNVIYPQEIIDKYGADILRLWTATSDYREDIRISKEIINGLIDTYRKIRNTLRFLLGNIYDFNLDEKVPYNQMREIDQHALYKLQDVIKDVTNAYETYEFHKASVVINNFCTVYLSGFYLDALKDTLYCDAPSWESRKSAQTALLEISSNIIRLLAPILSYTSEEAWQELRNKDTSLPESVFLCDFPKLNKEYLFDNSSKDRWLKLFDIREKALGEFENLRKEKKIGSNLEAHYKLDNKDLEKDSIDVSKDKDLLAMVIGTWDIFADSTKQVKTYVEKSKHNKCERCWRYIEDVNKQNKYGENLCARCVKALEDYPQEVVKE